MIEMMDNKKPLHIPQSKKWKGLTVFCNKCKMDVSEICKENGKPISKCVHGDKHVFKLTIHVPGTRNKRKTRKLETRDVNTAVQQAIKLEKEIKENLEHGREEKELKEELRIEELSRPYLWTHIVARYIAWLNNEGVPDHLVEERSKEHILDVDRIIRFMISCLVSHGHDLSAFSIDNINDQIVGQVFAALKKKGYSNRSIQKYKNTYSSILKWYGEQYNYPIKGYFKKIKITLNPQPEAITYSEYAALLDQVTFENGERLYEGVKEKRNFYRDWLKFGFRLALETGRRREELTTMKWNDIKERDGRKYIRVEDKKVNRIQGRTEEVQKKVNSTPITQSLWQLLDEMGYEKYKDSDKYILAPEVTISRQKVMCDALTRGFTHFYKQLNTGRGLTFKSFRKTYLTALEYHFGENARMISGHSSNAILLGSYVDPVAKATSASSLVLFPSETMRKNELEVVRNETKNNQQQKDLNI